MYMWCKLLCVLVAVLGAELPMRTQRPVVGESERRTGRHQVPLLHQGGPGEVGGRCGSKEYQVEIWWSYM